MGKSSEDSGDFFGKSLNEKIQSKINNLPAGVYKVVYLDKKFIPSTRDGLDRMELYVEVKETDNKDVLVGNKYSIPYFKDKDGFGAKDLAKFISQTTGSEEQLTGKEVISTLEEIKGNTCRVNVSVKKRKDGTPVTTKKGVVVLGYDFGIFDELVQA
jgi:hypothetical protein